MAKSKNSDVMATAMESAAQSFDDAIASRVAGWEQEQVGFPPYWKAGMGKRLLGRIAMLDNRDPEFRRYVIEASVPMVCQRGPAHDAEPVSVAPGEFFTMSAYAALPLDTFFGIEVLLEVISERKLPGNEMSKGVPRDIFDWKVLVSPADKKMLRARRQEETAALQIARTTKQISRQSDSL
jgi:hypothetical protein